MAEQGATTRRFAVRASSDPLNCDHPNIEANGVSGVALHRLQWRCSTCGTSVRAARSDES